MPSDQTVFAGVELSAGSKPVTFAALDNDLNIVRLEKWNILEVLSCLSDYEEISLAINMPTHAPEVYLDFKKKLAQAGFKPYARKSHPRQWWQTNAQDCFLALIGQNLLPRHSLEGRLQRALILYEQGVQIEDPMEIFEEITRYKLLQGLLPFEKIYSSRQLDTLAAAYVAWLVPNQTELTLAIGEHILEKIIRPGSASKQRKEY
ncbi:MAG TPA: hypothetical protein VK249_10270 [Anaerolineales bacterium]|nr:hypothetical protein [Anaerolineales bacterium]